jgi:hypothetical protein
MTTKIAAGIMKEAIEIVADNTKIWMNLKVKRRLRLPKQQSIW